MSVRVRGPQRIIANISILVQSLRISDVRVWKCCVGLDILAGERVYDSTRELVGRSEASLSRAKVPGPEVIEARLGISFFGGELRFQPSHTKHRTSAVGCRWDIF